MNMCAKSVSISKSSSEVYKMDNKAQPSGVYFRSKILTKKYFNVIQCIDRVKEKKKSQ